jgi:hypothetical protein
METVQISPEEINGEGNLLYTVIFIDEDDHEDTNIELWKANDEDHLYEQVKEEVVQSSEERMENTIFDDSWGYTILHKFIGALNHII